MILGNTNQSHNNWYDAWSVDAQLLVLVRASWGFQNLPNHIEHWLVVWNIFDFPQ